MNSRIPALLARSHRYRLTTLQRYKMQNGERANAYRTEGDPA